MRIGQIDTPGTGPHREEGDPPSHLFQNLQLDPLRVDGRVDTVIRVLSDPYQTSFFLGLGTPCGSALLATLVFQKWPILGADRDSIDWFSTAHEWVFI